MNIGIITFWESTDNYGQVLQAYALQQVLQNMGHEPFLIRYSLKASQGIVNMSSLIKKMCKLLAVYPALKSIKHQRKNKEDEVYRKSIEFKNVTRKFSEFREKYIAQSALIYNSIDELRLNPPKADCYITGSDQVWTMLLNTEGNKAYFLDFGDKKIKRIAYAASFARNKYPSDLIAILKEQLSKFDAISVREDEGVSICHLANRYDAIKVLDPTFLLDKDVYLKLIENVSLSHRDYAFTYSINIRDAKELAWDEVCAYANKLNLEMLTVTSSGHFPGREILSGTKYIYATIPEWIAYINNAKFVVTTSFHGVAFCIILNMQFVYFPLGGTEARGNGRVISLLQELGLMSRIYSGSGIESLLEKKIDWDMVNHSLEQMKKKSIDFLNQNIRN